MSGRGLAAFVAGFGTGYLNAEQKKKEQERQAKLDQIQFDKADREKAEYDENQALNAKIAQAAKPTYADQTKVDAEGLRGMMPGTFQDTETARNFIDNPNATTEQKASILQNYAQLPESGANMNGQQLVADNEGSLSVADPASKQNKPLWKTMQDASYIYLENGKQEHADKAMKMLEYSQKLRSHDYMGRIMEARKSGVDGLFKLMHDHPGDELDIQNPRIKTSSDGNIAFLEGENSAGKPINPVTFDLRNGSVEDQITQRLMSMSSPDAMMQHISNQISAAKQARKEGFEERKLEANERIAGMREDRRDERQQRQISAMDERQSRQLNAYQNRAEATSNKITPAQEANNKEIALARKRLNGMSMDDIKGKLQPYLANGRDNPEYDATISSTWRAANQRMIGNDDAFDEFTKRTRPIKKQQLTPKQRFEADTAMRGMTMGKMTGRGWEVYDSNGRLIGHWQ